MKFGIKKEDLDYIVNEIKKYEEIEKATIFGSRAKGNYKHGSDIDIAIYGKKVNINIVAKLLTDLGECSKMPYMFDIIDFTHLEHKELREHIERVGIEIYKKAD
jgi:predicted nucleotidyltransferase